MRRIGEFTLERRLGAGGMGVVYLARSPAGRQVALKVIRPEYADDPLFRARFRREVAAARKVSGAFTASVVDAAPDGDPPWLATQYVPAESLAARARSGGPLPAPDVARLAGQLAEALRDIHRQGIVHRDLKPGNVLLAEDGVRVIDFGIARSAAESRALTRSGGMVGTPAFMAPEQLHGPHGISPATDVFALGSVLTFAAIGRSPFEDPGAAGLEPIAAAFAVVHKEPDLTGVPGPLRPLIVRCLDKDPGRRPLLDEVLRLAARAAEAGPDPVPPRRRRYGGRGTALAAGLAVLAALVVQGDAPRFAAGARDLGCADGLRSIGQGATRSCVGLMTPGSPDSEGPQWSPDSDLAPVLERIHAENRRVVEPGGRPYVSIVYLTPITAQYDGTSLMDTVRHDLEGAYFAQRRANRDPAAEEGVGIRLLFAQTGGTAAQREYTVGQVVGRQRAERIVAAVGLGGSTASSQDMIGGLTAGGLPAFGSVLTADSWAGTPGLVRVAPANADQAAAAVRFLSTGDHADARLLLVQDVAAGDQYISTLATQFRARAPRERLVDEEPTLFDSSQPGLTDAFRAQLARMCAAAPDVVYFAGRGTSLPAFLTALAERPCRERRLTVLSGDDTTQVTRTDGFGTEELSGALREGRIDLVYTGLAHPGAWEAAPGAFSAEAVAPFRDGDFAEAFPDSDLGDGRAIMMYDALLAATRAVRSTPAVSEPTATDVHRTLSALREGPGLPGASGWITIGGDGGPQDKAIPVIRIEPGGRTTAIAVTSADGTPLTPRHRAARAAR
ncbi:bifunctional serine/threonine-protein kinase/ABC transporter substrate-binding protein [Streptomyces sp. NPDC014894]|uniref:bifunctional serine/threonine-protein kinase/ABC transporter substrate-binding protein n=1 Tax=Streptomyces sp. NPDC014894 TaxID=3364931 RepID=UPI0037008DFB